MGLRSFLTLFTNRRLVLEFYYNHLSKKVKRNSFGRIIISRGSNIFLSKESSIVLQGKNLIIGSYSRLNTGKAYLIMQGKSILKTNGGEIRNDAVFNIYNGSVNTGYFVLGQKSKIMCGKELVIGDHVLIGENCFISDDDIHWIIHDGKRTNEPAFIRIGSNVWICNNAMILKKVVIGNNCIVGAGTLLANRIVNDNVKIVQRNNYCEGFIDEWK